MQGASAPHESDTAAEPSPTRSGDVRLVRVLETALSGFEGLLYAAVGLLLAATGALVVVGTVAELVDGVASNRGAVPTGVIVLDRVLLVLIVAELVYTLRLVLRTREIVVEPFLYVGLIAVVRRILIVTAQFERPPSGGRELTNLLLELGLLALLTVALASAIFLVRWGRRDNADTIS